MAKIIEQYNIFKSALLRWLTYVILAIGPVFLVMAKEMTKSSRAQMDWFDWLVFIVSVVILPTASVTRAFIDKTMSNIDTKSKN